MTLTSGARLGPYEIQTPLGSGGMGEVYRAKDTRLDRTVAIKILPAALAADPQFRERFEREARTISSLDHPNICALYDVGHQAGTDFLVMQYLEGQTLAERLAKGPLPLGEAFTIAIQLADALDKAHRAGIVHRDLKPGNLMLTKSGLKLLDFGLAKLKASDGAVDDLTRRTALTGQGTIWGTLQYMAPEQLEGKEADARTDIFAFGMVAYEMVAGHKPFDGESQASLVAAILTSNAAPISSLQPTIPPALDHVVRKCLAKKPEDRWQTARELVTELRWIAEGEALVEPTPARMATRARVFGSRLGWIVAVGSIVAALTLAGLYFQRAPGETRVARFAVFPPEGATFPAFPSFLTLSPDSRHLAFVAVGAEGRRRLWVRALDSISAQPLAGTEGADQPFWSADGRFIAFFAEGKLRKVSLSGGRPQTICQAAPARGGAWNRDGVIVFTPGSGAGLYRVPAAGGVAMPLTKLDRSRAESDHLWPQFLPDGRRFLYLARSSEPENTGIYLGSLDSEKRQLLLKVDSNVAYVPPGYLVFQREGTLTAQLFDPSRAQLTSEAVSVASEVSYNTANGRGAFAVSENGVLAYRGGLDNAHTEAAWFDRRGKRLGLLDVSDANPDFWFSPDEKSVAFSRVDKKTGTDIWLGDLSHSTFSRFTFDPGIDGLPTWSPDGRLIVFASNRAGSFDLYQKVSSGAGNDEVLLKSSSDKYPSDWSWDGRLIAYYSPGSKGDFDVWILPLFGERKARPFLRTEFDERNGRFSPDGRWMAYVSNESGSYEVYVQPISATSGGKWQISTTGGYQPRWRRDGKELFYLAADGKVMAISVKAEGGFGAEVPRALFQTRLDPAVLVNERNYAVTADGQRFLVATPLGTSTPITVVLNWTTALKK